MGFSFSTPTIGHTSKCVGGINRLLNCPITSILSGEIPISSSVSRNAVAIAFSSWSSTLPPGSETCPRCTFSADDRLVRIILNDSEKGFNKSKTALLLGRCFESLLRISSFRNSGAINNCASSPSNGVCKHCLIFSS